MPHASPPPDSAVPGGLVLFRPGTPPTVRRRRLAVASIVLVAGLSLIWPVYPIFGAIRPFVLGLPLSLAWPVFWLVVVFIAFAWLYRTE